MEANNKNKTFIATKIERSKPSTEGIWRVYNDENVMLGYIYNLDDIIHFYNIFFEKESKIVSSAFVLSPDKQSITRVGMLVNNEYVDVIFKREFVEEVLILTKLQ